MQYTKGIHEVADGVWAYLQPDGSWGWSNAGLVAGDGTALLVDTLFDERLTAEMLGTMRREVPAAARIGTVVNTHANGDHCWGNHLLEGAEIVASRAAAEEMGELDPAVLAAMVRQAPTMGDAGAYFARIFGGFDFEHVRLTLPTTTFDGARTLHVGPREVRLLEVGPAHTRGDVIVHLPGEGVVFTGDILFAEAHPVIWSGPVGNWIRACDRILDIDPGVVVPGHGPVAGVAAVAALKGYLEHLAAEARARYEGGMDPFEAARDIPLGDYGAWGDAERVVVNVVALYREFGAAVADDRMALFSQMADLAHELEGRTRRP